MCIKENVIHASKIVLIVQIQVHVMFVKVPIIWGNILPVWSAIPALPALEIIPGVHLVSQNIILVILPA
jgi:hypothetical protein